jgi:hypothetical protein
MKQKSLFAFLFLLFCLIQSTAFAQGTSLIKFSFGLGYDNVSERYYLAHYDTISVPSESLEALRRATEEIEEQKAIVKFDLNKDFANHSRLSVNNRFSFSSLYLRDILKIEWDKDWLNLSNQAELKTIQDKKKVTYQTDYFTNNFDVKLKARLSPELILRFRNNLEYTEYKEDSTYTYDYYLNRAGLELDKDISSDGFLHLSYQFSKRYVPDSTLINYDRHFLDISFDKYFGWETLLQLGNELDRKTFKKPGGLDNFWEERVIFGLSRRIHDKMELLFHNEFEVLSYDIEDEINFDYFENKFSTALDYELSYGCEIKGGPEWVTFSSLKNLYREYNYDQLAFSLSFDLFRSTDLWLSIEDKFGRRDYKSDENPFYTDYLLNQISLFLDGELGAHLGFNLMLSIDSEWHNSRGDNLTVFLISSELTYSF